ncbi:WD repeat domain 63, partial [Podarcis lilfordi]
GRTSILPLLSVFKAAWDSIYTCQREKQMSKRKTKKLLMKRNIVLNPMTKKAVFNYLWPFRSVTLQSCGPEMLKLLARELGLFALTLLCLPWGCLLLGQGPAASEDGLETSAGAKFSSQTPKPEQVIVPVCEHSFGTRTQTEAVIWFLNVFESETDFRNGFRSTSKSTNQDPKYGYCSPYFYFSFTQRGMYRAVCMQPTIAIMQTNGTQKRLSHAGHMTRKLYFQKDTLMASEEQWLTRKRDFDFHNNGYLFYIPLRLSMHTDMHSILVPYLDCYKQHSKKYDVHDTEAEKKMKQPFPQFLQRAAIVNRCIDHTKFSTQLSPNRGLPETWRDFLLLCRSHLPIFRMDLHDGPACLVLVSKGPLSVSGEEAVKGHIILITFFVGQIWRSTKPKAGGQSTLDQISTSPGSTEPQLMKTHQAVSGMNQLQAKVCSQLQHQNEFSEGQRPRSTEEASSFRSVHRITCPPSIYLGFIMTLLCHRGSSAGARKLSQLYKAVPAPPIRGMFSLTDVCRSPGVISGLPPVELSREETEDKGNIAKGILYSTINYSMLYFLEWTERNFLFLLQQHLGPSLQRIEGSLRLEPSGDCLLLLAQAYSIAAVAGGPSHPIKQKHFQNGRLTPVLRWSLKRPRRMTKPLLANQSSARKHRLPSRWSGLYLYGCMWVRIQGHYPIFGSHEAREQRTLGMAITICNKKRAFNGKPKMVSISWTDYRLRVIEIARRLHNPVYAFLYTVLGWGMALQNSEQCKFQEIALLQSHVVLERANEVGKT